MPDVMTPQPTQHSAIVATVNIHHQLVTGTFPLRDFDTKPYLLLSETEDRDKKRTEHRIYLDKKRIKEAIGFLSYPDTLTTIDIKYEVIG
jgi:hypothetical protein